MTDLPFVLLHSHDLVIEGPEPLRAKALLSPFVWREGDRLLMLLRSQPEAEDVSGRIWLGESDDGLTFRMDAEPLLVPSLPHLDDGGCEDPTVVVRDGVTIVFYTGVDADGRGEMLFASGPDVRHMVKRGVAFSCSKTELNTKEATVDLSVPGEWRLFHEYARDGRSCIGLAVGPAPDGPWDERPDPIRARADSWDCFHLSTGPLVDNGEGDLTMFYNGADRQPRWSIGWATFDRETLALRERCEAPLIEPPANDGDKRQIVFAASVVEEGDLLHLYYSRDDEMPRRATLRRL